MTPLVKIQKESNCSIAVIDITQDSDQYLMENIEDTTAYHQRNKFKYSETVTINILMKHTQEESKVVQFVVTLTKSILVLKMMVTILLNMRLFLRQIMLT